MTLPPRGWPGSGQHDEWTTRVTFLCLRRLTPCFPWWVLRDTLYPSIHTRVSKPAIFPCWERERHLGLGTVFALVNGSGPNEGMHRRLVLLQAYEARRGKVVWVRHGHWKDEFAGMRGTIQGCWGNSEHAAVEILLEDGSCELFWLADLSEVDEHITV
jgi:hypothetical protein